MDTTLSGIPSACTYLDDVIVSGVTREEHAWRLDMVLGHLKTTNL